MIISKITQYYLSVDNKLNNIASAQFTKYLHDHLSSVSGVMDYKETVHYKKLTARSRAAHSPDEMLRNNANNQPDYIFFVTSDITLEYFLSSLLGYQNFKQHPVFQQAIVPSSTLIIEVVENDVGEMNVEAYFNDVPLMLQGCN